MATVQYSELDAYPKQELGHNYATATRKLMCAWGDRLVLAKQLLNDNLGFGELYPYDPTSLARASRVAIDGFGASTSGGSMGIIAYEWAHLLVTYATPNAGDERPAGGSSTESIIERFEGTAEMQLLPHEKFRWQTGTRPLLKPEEAPAKAHLGMEYILTRGRMTAPNVPAFGLTGSVNASAFTLVTFNIQFPPESLRFMPPQTEHAVNPRSGQSLFSTTYRLTIRLIPDPDNPNAPLIGGWNHFWRAASNRYERILHLDGPNANQIYRNYPLANFGVL